MALVIQEAYHELVIGNVALDGVALPDAFHLQEADNLALDIVFVLTVAACGHAMRNSICTPSEPNPIVCPIDGMIMPTLRSTGETDTKINCALLGLKLSPIELTISMGSVVESNLPVIECSATATDIILLQITSNLPVPTISARSGITCDLDLKLPTISSSATSIYFQAKLSKTLPGISINATGSAPRTGTLSKDLPPLSISATGKRAEESANLSANIPTLKISATGIKALSGSMASNLPILESSGSTGASGSIVSYLPWIHTHSSGKDIEPATDPYDGYILRYVR